MKIRKVTCDQFAGLTDQELKFEDGLNLLVGDNETGKSTMIDLIYQLLFQDSKLNKRTDGDFIRRYFPRKTGGISGDVVDGSITFETQEGTYRLRKEWDSAGGSCRLTMPDGTTVKDPSAIGTILKEQLKARAGVYNEIVFASQKRRQLAVESIMGKLGRKADPLSEAREDLASVLTQASLETGGVSIEKIGKGIQEKLDTLGGRWDFAADAPEGGRKRASYKDRWTKGAGIIAQAYYDADETSSRQRQEEDAERAVEQETARIRDIKALRKTVDEKKRTFLQYSGIIGQINLLNNEIREADRKAAEYDRILSSWPKASRQLEEAKALKTRYLQAQVHAQYQEAEAARTAYLEKKAELSKLHEVDQNDVRQLSTLIRQKQREESRLGGMDLSAKIKKLGDVDVKVVSEATGKEIIVPEGPFDIKEAVKVLVPGVVEFELMPRGTDVDKVRDAISLAGKQIQEIYEKYQVSSPEELQDLSARYIAVSHDAERLKSSFEHALGGSSWDALEEAEGKVPEDIGTVTEVRNRILELCGSSPIDAFIGGRQNALDEYTRKFESPEKLLAETEDIVKKRESSRKKAESISQIPDEFRNIADPDRYSEDLQNRIDELDAQAESHEQALQDAERLLGEKSAEDFAEELEQKEAVLEAAKEEYRHWLHIQSVFLGTKDTAGSNPAQDIADSFRKYLSVITNGSLKLTDMDDSLSVSLASGSHALSYDILSDGTKDTISLAFRLAMLEHIFQDGDGIAIFDDPFTDMDPGRVRQACCLIQEFAKKNQVIFVTCDEKYKKYLTGNVIEVT